MLFLYSSLIIVNKNKINYNKVKLNNNKNRIISFVVYYMSNVPGHREGRSRKWMC